MSKYEEKTFEVKAKLTLKDNEVVIINNVPLSAELIRQLDQIFEDPGYREHVIAGLAGHMWLLTRLQEDAPLGDHNEMFFTIVNNLYDSMKEFELIRGIQNR